MTFIVAWFFIVIIGRYVACYVAYYIFICMPSCKNNQDNNNKLSFKEVTFISWAALIRGAIALGLVAKVKESYLVLQDEHGTPIPHTKQNQKVVESATLALVVVTTVLFGGLTNCV